MKYRITFCGLAKEVKDEAELAAILADSVIQAYPARVEITFLGNPEAKDGNQAN